MTQDAAACGLDLVDMPDGISPIAALVVVKAFDADGDVSYFARATESLTAVEALGMAEYAAARLRKSLTDGDDE